MYNDVLLIGNGPSRKNIDIKSFKYDILKHDSNIVLPTFGCNAIWRDFDISLFTGICIWDVEPLKDILSTIGVTTNILLIPYEIDRKKVLHSNSGMFLLHFVAEKYPANNIHIIGFDQLIRNGSKSSLYGYEGPAHNEPYVLSSSLYKDRSNEMTSWIINNDYTQYHVYTNTKLSSNNKYDIPNLQYHSIES